MAIGGWTLMLAASVAWGAALCAGMVVTRRWLPAVVGVGLIASAGVFLGLLVVWRDGHRPDVVVDLHRGGQPLYPYLVAVE